MLYCECFQQFVLSHVQELCYLHMRSMQVDHSLVEMNQWMNQWEITLFWLHQYHMFWKRDPAFHHIIQPGWCGGRPWSVWRKEVCRTPVVNWAKQCTQSPHTLKGVRTCLAFTPMVWEEKRLMHRRSGGGLFLPLWEATTMVHLSSFLPAHPIPSNTSAKQGSSPWPPISRLEGEVWGQWGCVLFFLRMKESACV